MSLRRPLDASLLFEASELVKFEHWLSLHLQEDDLVGSPSIPTAQEYAEFQQWRTEERARQSPSVPFLASAASNMEKDSEREISEFTRAQKCKHILHPAHTDMTVMELATLSDTTSDEEKVDETISWCPMCTLRQHDSLIEALYTKWTDLGGPWRAATLPSTQERIAYSDTNRAYQKARVDLVNTMSRFESMAEQEANWNLAHTDRGMDNVMEYSATAALHEYRKSISFPARLQDPVGSKSAPQTRAAKRLRERKLTYSADTPDDTAHRPQALWARSTASHDPDSPHACPSEEGYEDTSYFNNWHFSVSQCRILICYCPDTEDDELRYRDLNAGPDRGLDNPHVQRLIRIIEELVAKKTPEEQLKWISYLKATSDIMLVYDESDGFFDENNDMFTHFDGTPTLLGSQVEAWARLVGDIDDEEWATRKAEAEDKVPDQDQDEDMEEDEEALREDYYDQESLASASDDDSGSGTTATARWADPMDLEDEGET
ncbi:hypothetical protein ACEQ8H_007662 [Pleosporales sp. CAS-2024a]